MPTLKTRAHGRLSLSRSLGGRSEHDLEVGKRQEDLFSKVDSCSTIMKHLRNQCNSETAWGSAAQSETQTPLLRQKASAGRENFRPFFGKTVFLQLAGGHEFPVGAKSICSNIHATTHRSGLSASAVGTVTGIIKSWILPRQYQFRQYQCPTPCGAASPRSSAWPPRTMTRSSACGCARFGACPAIFR
jgi:hypothetical protein